MKEQYFNPNEFKKALSLVDTNPFLAKSLYEEYLTKYPKDYCAYAYYATLLITLGKLDEAEKVLNKVNTLSKNNHHFNNDISRRRAYECNYTFTKIRLLCYKKEYEKMYPLTFHSFDELNENVELDATRFFYKKLSNKLNISRDQLNSYLYRQIYEYRESEFMEHISKHMADYNQNIDNPNTSIFVPEFPINEIISEIKKHIPSNKRLLPGFIDDAYYFKYDECGRSNNKIVNYFRVVCFHDTQNFITMYPITDCKDLPYIDLNYLKKDDKPIVKRKSRIELFNQKYNRN